jgi:phosphohistidine phosphatase SixA
LERPPITNLVAAKLVRAEGKDLEDIAYLVSTYLPARQAIEQAIQSMPREAREKAVENLVYLDAMSGNQ